LNQGLWVIFNKFILIDILTNLLTYNYQLCITQFYQRASDRHSFVLHNKIVLKTQKWSHWKAYKLTPVPSTGIKDLFTSLLELNFKLWNSNRSKKVRAALKGFWIKNRRRTNCQTRIECIRLDFFRCTQKVLYIIWIIYKHVIMFQSSIHRFVFVLTRSHSSLKHYVRHNDNMLSSENFPKRWSLCLILYNYSGYILAAVQWVL